MGLAGYLCRFVKGFASPASHMTSMIQKEVSFVWDGKCEKSFQKLKTLFTLAPILTHPIKCKDFII